MQSSYDVIVLAGGRARRLGGADKPSLDVGGTSLLDRVLGAVQPAGQRIVVGPPRALPSDVLQVREDPPASGPLAATAAGLALAQADVVLLLAADLPRIGPAVPALLAELAGSDADAAALADPTGRLNLLASAWRAAALRTALAAVGVPAGRPMRDLLRHAHVRALADPDGWGRDCDTWADVAAARDTWADVAAARGATFGGMR